MDASTRCYVKYINSLSLEKPWLEVIVRKHELAFSRKWVFEKWDLSSLKTRFECSKLST
jgi:hypothetical protein